MSKFGLKDYTASELIKQRKYDLPIIIEGFDDTDRYDKDYTVNTVKDIEAVKKFYTDLGIEILEIEHIAPSIGPERDEIIAYYPDGWEEKGDGQSPWVSVFNEKNEEVFEMFVKKAPWDYCFFTRPR